ncbi:hypothetical protein [Haloarcula salina]|uniref:Uncharacterized protein n=1 Tax=Haloarcula salina TaxID=1429914 RepID=A0AA41KMI2_9EURY|nr:hypothetical protein [Haloarcula salina]MBV0903924.1 hypothetical protein [Haloarcula salina]
MTVVIDPRDLSRGQQERLQRGGDAFDELAEELVAEEWGLEGLGLEAEWWDLRHPDRPTKYEVKSTQSTIGEDYPADGRFRVWEGQTRSLVASDAQGTAWYAFVLFDEDAGLLRIQRRRPSTVLSVVQERGGWNESGHESMGRQHKLPIETVIDL